MIKRKRSDNLQRAASNSADPSLPPPVTPETASTAPKVQREENLLDEALIQTFPASDPVAEMPVSCDSEKNLVDDAMEHLLDEAISMTFPASDPIAINSGNTRKKSS